MSIKYQLGDNVTGIVLQVRAERSGSQHGVSVKELRKMLRDIHPHLGTWIQPALDALASLLKDERELMRGMHEICRVGHAGKPTKDMLDDLKRLHRGRNTAATEWRVCGWKPGVFMGPNWMDGASTSFVRKIAKFIQVFITDVSGWRDQECLDNQLLCVRHHLGIAFNSRNEWRPIFLMLKHAEPRVVPHLLDSLAGLRHYPQVRLVWSRLSTRARAEFCDLGIALLFNQDQVKSPQVELLDDICSLLYQPCSMAIALVGDFFEDNAAMMIFEDFFLRISEHAVLEVYPRVREAIGGLAKLPSARDIAQRWKFHG